MFNTWLRWSINLIQGSVTHIIEYNGWTVFGTLVAEGDIVDMKSLDVTGIETVCWRRPCLTGFRLVGALFAIISFHQILGAATSECQSDIRQPHIANGLVLHAGNDDGT